jgi:uncharacterized protein (TIGR00375 family)
MKLIADFHIHSKYSRGCSRQLNLENIALWCGYKGIGLVSTGDFTHPQWLKEIKSQLQSDGRGFFVLKEGNNKVKFILGAEISCIYTQGGKCRKNHLCLLAPSLSAVEKLNQRLTALGCNLRSDGRPIIGLSAKKLLEICLNIDRDFFIFPAHAWTPWFSVFGSRSGFNSLEECFEELTENIFALETGLSSDPLMNWSCSMLDKLSLLSNSDAHSLQNLGREANVFEVSKNFSYQELIKIIKNKDKNKFLYTIEFFPEEGKYHLDGHADCNYSCTPEESESNNNLCPHCGKSLILGVLNRVKVLSDRKEKEIKKVGFIPYKNIIPLLEIIANYFGVGKNSQKVLNLYLSLVKNNNEFEILIDLTQKELEKIMESKLAEKIIKVRNNQVEIKPGFDGVFGKISIK